jgi:hypothetical protein
VAADLPALALAYVHASWAAACPSLLSSQKVGMDELKKEASREAHRKSDKDYYWRNREDILIQKQSIWKSYYENNKEKVKERMRAYRARMREMAEIPAFS